jgi:hypothetical protein
MTGVFDLSQLALSTGDVLASAHGLSHFRQYIERHKLTDAREALEICSGADGGLALPGVDIAAALRAVHAAMPGFMDSEEYKAFLQVCAHGRGRGLVRQCWTVP